jgi:hypothetical protein
VQENNIVFYKLVGILYIYILVIILMNIKDYCLTTTIDDIEFRKDAYFSWFANHILYILSEHAKMWFKQKIWLQPDFCIFTNCEVIEQQCSIISTPESRYKIFWFDRTKGLREELLWWTRRIPSKTWYVTTPWLTAHWEECWLLISTQDIEKALRPLPYNQQEFMR